MNDESEKKFIEQLREEKEIAQLSKESAPPALKPFEEIDQPRYGNAKQKQSVLAQMQACLENMERWRPEGRSEEARRWAISITEMEKALSYFKTYVIGK